MTTYRAARRALMLLTLSAACHSSNDQQKKPQPAVPVRVAPAARIDAPITVAASGVVEPMQTVNVEAQATGTVLEVSFKQGDWVRAGQVLFRLDPRPLQDALAQSRAALARDQAQATAASHDAERYNTLAGEGYVTRSQAEQTHASALAQAATVVADRAAVRTAERNLSYATIRAPIAGRTGSVQLRRGDLVGPQTGSLVVINQLRPIQVRFPVLAGDFDLLRAAVATHALPVTASSSDSANVRETGTLNFLDNAIDSLTGTVTGRAVFANEGGRMWPGQLVFLSVQAGVQRGVLAVPSQAIQTGQQGAYVYVVNTQRSTVQTRNVAAGRAVGDVTIINGGLSDGEQVVTDGQTRLNQGSRVAVVSPVRQGNGGAGGQVAGGSNAGGVGGSGGGAAVGGAVAAGSAAGDVGGAGGAAGGASGVAAGAVATDGASGVAASGGRASPYSGAPSTSGQTPGSAASQTVAPGATQAPVGSAVLPQTGTARGGGVGTGNGTGVGTGVGTSVGTGVGTGAGVGPGARAGAPTGAGAGAGTASGAGAVSPGATVGAGGAATGASAAGGGARP